MSKDLFYILLLYGLFNLSFLFFIKYLGNIFIDIPNKRGSHKKKTPSGAGIIISIFSSILNLNQSYNPFMISLPLSIVGLLDDKSEVKSSIRYISQALTITFILLLSSQFNIIVEYLNNNIFLTIFILSQILIGTSLINFTNFLDCLDGLIASSTLIIFITLSFDNPKLIPFVVGLASLLNWNWNLAKTFMGDSGSTFIGAIFFSEIINSGSIKEYFLKMILFTPILLDAITCLLRRFKNGYNIFQSHKMHLAQRLHISGWSHSQVSILYAFFTTILCLEYKFTGSKTLLITCIFIFIIGYFLDKKVASPFAK